MLTFIDANTTIVCDVDVCSARYAPPSELPPTIEREQAAAEDGWDVQDVWPRHRCPECVRMGAMPKPRTVRRVSS
jgi:hypothetical protein